MIGAASKYYRFCLAYSCHTRIPVEDGADGRPRVYCSDACKQKAYRMRAKRRRYETIATQDGESEISLRIDKRDHGVEMEIPESSITERTFAGRPAQATRDDSRTRIPWDKVKRHPRARALGHLTSAQNRARQIRSLMFQVWTTRARLMRSSLGSDARDLLRRLDDKERALRRELKQL